MLRARHQICSPFYVLLLDYRNLLFVSCSLITFFNFEGAFYRSSVAGISVLTDGGGGGGAAWLCECSSIYGRLGLAGHQWQRLGTLRLRFHFSSEFMFVSVE